MASCHAHFYKGRTAFSDRLVLGARADALPSFCFTHRKARKGACYRRIYFTLTLVNRFITVRKLHRDPTWKWGNCTGTLVGHMVTWPCFGSCRGLLDDDNFHQRMSEISQEPVPYFRQLCEAQYTTSSRPSSASGQSSTIGEEFGGELEQIHRSTQVKQTLWVNAVSLNEWWVCFLNLCNCLKLYIVYTKSK